MDTRQFYDRTAQDYDSRHDNDTTRYMRMHETRLLKKYARGKILDIGCGTGAYLNKNSIGLDISSGMLKQARDKGFKNLVLGSAETLPMKDQSIDTVICMFNVLGFCDIQKSVSEMHRVLKKDGIVIVSMSSIWESYNDSLVKRIFTTRQSTKKKFRIEKERLWFHVLNKRDFIGLFKNNGFELVKFDGIFILQRPYWGWFRDFTKFEKLKLKFERLMPKRAARTYFGVFRKQ